MNLKKYIAELKKRHVIKAGLGYLVAAWVFTEVSSLILDSFDAPAHLMKTILVVLAIGFPIWLGFSWVYDITSEGIKKTGKTDQGKGETVRIDKRVNRAIISLLAIAVILLSVNQFRAKPNKNTEFQAVEKSLELVAVLPFFNTKDDPETNYLGFAMADQIIGGLLYLKNITVRPSASVRKYEQQAIDPEIVGEDLQVDYVLMGNYLKEANTIRLNVELINVKSNEIIWREPLEVDFTSAFELQDIVAQHVIEGMNVQFTQKELNRISKDIPADPLAYEYFLKSISYKHNNEGDRLAIEMINKSIELDSNYAPAFYQLADRLHRYAQYGLLDPEETRRAEKAFLKALELNGELIPALGSLSSIYTETNRIIEAVQLTKQILEINPNSAEAHYSMGYAYRYAGMNDEAIEQMEKAMSLDPKNQGFRSICNTYLVAGKYDMAVESVDLFEESGFLLQVQGQARFRQGKHDQALIYLNRAIDLDPGKLAALTSIGVKAFIEGNLEEGIRASQKFESYNIADAEAWYFIAGNYGLLGNVEGCLRCLRRAVNGGFFNYPLMSTDFYLDSARDDPEFHTILEDAHKRHQAFKKKFSDRRESSPK